MHPLQFDNQAPARCEVDPGFHRFSNPGAESIQGSTLRSPATQTGSR